MVRSLLSAGHLNARQRSLLERWSLTEATVTEDYSGEDSTSTVLKCLTTDGEHIIVKAGDEFDTHVAREVRAHRKWLQPWAESGVCPQILWGDQEAKLLVTSHLPGDTALNEPLRLSATVHRKAGEHLKTLHGTARPDDGNYISTLAGNVRTWLDKCSHLAPELSATVRSDVAMWKREPALLVPAHGDYQPRNWLVHQDDLRVIDFGRMAPRPAESELTHLVRCEWATMPELAAAFAAGYGSDLTRRPLWRHHLIAEVVGELAWAHRINNAANIQRHAAFLRRLLLP